jgi:hypothetical protein
VVPSKEPKTRPTAVSVRGFIDAHPDERRRDEARVIDQLMRDVTGEKPVMWGTTIIGYGQYASPTGPWPITGFSPRKAQLVVYVMAGFDEMKPLLARLGKHSTGASCLYIKKLVDVDAKVLREIVARGVALMRRRHG